MENNQADTPKASDSNVKQTVSNVKQAVKAAMEFFLEVFPNVTDPRLEEVELSEDGEFWNVTISFSIGTTAFGVLIGQAQAGRVYKLIEVSKATGEPKSIKMRKL